MTIQAIIEQKLADEFNPLHLEVINESHNHNVASGSESHFKVVIATNDFEGKRLLQRHRAMNALLSVELAEHIHALALHTYTEKEWLEKYQNQVPVSPKCMGGSKR